MSYEGAPWSRRDNSLLLGKQEVIQKLIRADRLMPDMPETLYSPGKAASLEGDTAAAERAWTKLLSIEKQSSLAAQAHFRLAGIYRKQGKAEQAKQEMQAFQSLQPSTPAQNNRDEGRSQSASSPFAIFGKIHFLVCRFIRTGGICSVDRVVDLDAALLHFLEKQIGGYIALLQNCAALGDRPRNQHLQHD